MKIVVNNNIVFIFFCLAATIAGCSEDVWDIDDLGIPKFVESDYIQLDGIYRISKFRSSEGHDYSDDFEKCRSMKHYFEPYSTTNWSSIKIYSPVSGVIKEVVSEWAGYQVIILSDEYPAFEFIIFHMNLLPGFKTGTKVASGEQIGNHTGNQTMSDIAVKVRVTSKKIKFVSYFDTMTDDVFILYQNRGVISRAILIIPKTERDSDPLSCEGEKFINRGSLANWVYLF